MSTIYLLTGTQGEYSDRSDWNVRAFVRRERAEALKTTLEGLATEAYRLRSDCVYTASEEVLKKIKALDPGASEWGMIDYDIEEIELEGESA
jgi:hypothetical protein